MDEGPARRSRLHSPHGRAWRRDRAGGAPGAGGLRIGSGHGASFGSYEDPIELWQRADAFLAARRMGGSIVDAVNELYQVQERAKKKSKARAASLAAAAATGSTALLHKRVIVRRGKSATRIHLRLPRTMVRALRARASRKSHAVAVRLVVSFKAKPRPIVRFVDFRLQVKQKARRRK